ncbi:omega-hydroxypalmitate O-feruloyl transferase-like [Macadamia integrifolia]|uniref:omega-hydroxypalmitate O-feruloyl transferase-like n=1 Tax=Macadamia integrifolia TaxID=60698 RepID=UPI001C4E3554|nr:omega-hydroxypalmitate O-feruloyl transferase-like [Macadamia integrifolia]
MEDGEVEKCSNFTAVAAHSWCVMTESLKMEADQLTKLVFPVDLRLKFNLPLPKGYFGNAIIHPSCLCSAGELRSKPLSFTVKLVQEVIKSVIEKYARSAIDYHRSEKSKSFGNLYSLKTLYIFKD